MKHAQSYPVPGRKDRKVLDMRGARSVGRKPPPGISSLPIGSLVGWIGAQSDLAAAVTAFADLGFEPCNTGDNDLGGKFLVGYKSGDADYGTMRATGGNAAHGEGVNDHLPHLMNHYNPVSTDSIIVQEYPESCINNPPGNGVAQYTFVTEVQPLSACAAQLDNWCSDVQTPAEERAVEAGDGDRVLHGHSASDNRPPYSVVGFIVKL